MGKQSTTITVNDMIRNTLLTKLTKEPKYKLVLEAMGYELVDEGWSEYNNWQIRLKGTTPEQVGVLCISKGRGNRAGIFKGPWYLRELKGNEQIRDVLKLIDFEN